MAATVESVDAALIEHELIRAPARECATLGVVGSQYTDEQRRAAVGMWLVLGNMRRVAEQLNIPHTTLLGWQKTEWWNDCVVEVRAEKNEEIDCVLTGAIERALDVVQDRLDKGNCVIHDGVVMRVGVSAKDAAVVAGVLFDKRQLLRALPTNINAKQDSALDHLAGRLTSLLERQKPNP